MRWPSQVIDPWRLVLLQAAESVRSTLLIQISLLHRSSHDFSEHQGAVPDSTLGTKLLLLCRDDGSSSSTSQLPCMAMQAYEHVRLVAPMQHTLSYLLSAMRADLLHALQVTSTRNTHTRDTQQTAPGPEAKPGP